MAIGVSGRELSRRAGISEAAIRKAEKAGRITKLADGTYDAEASLAGLCRNTDPARIKVRAPANQAVRTPPVRNEADAEEAVALIERVLKAQGVDASVIGFNEARTADTILKAAERDLKIAQRRKELVPLTVVKGHIEKAFIGYRQATQRIPSRHAAAMAAELGCDAGALDSLLNKAIAAELDALSTPVVRT